MKPKRSVAVAAWLLAAVVLAGLAGLWWLNSHSRKTGFDGKRPTTGAASSTQPAGDAISGATTPGRSQEAIPKADGGGPAGATHQVGTNAKADAHGAVEVPDLVSNGPVASVSLANFPRPIQNVFELQVALARQCLSSGSIDGRLGPQTRAALRSFQQREQLPVTGELDTNTRARLLLTAPATTAYEVSSNDLARLQPLSPTWLGKSQQSALEYESLLELVAEKAQAHPGLVRRLNPEVNWTNLVAGATVQVPNVNYPPPPRHAEFLIIWLSDKVLEAWDSNTNLLAHFPCSIARRVEKRPVGELHVAVIAPHPTYTFDPEVFPESAEAKELKTKLILPPGPNSPVGVAWIGLDKPGYGIHGTPSPEQVGRTESHGCFRLANWNAEYLVKLVTIGTPVYVRP